MLIPTDQVAAVKSLLGEMGVRWSAPLEPNPIQPICKGFFQGHLVAVYQESSDSAVSEIRCLDGYSDQFESLLASFMNPVEESKDLDDSNEDMP